MNVWQELQREREHRERLLAEAARDRLLAAACAGRPGLRDRAAGRALSWAIAAHRRLHELESARLRSESA